MTSERMERDSEAGPDLSGFRGNEALGHLLAAGRPVVLTGRFSGESGAATWRAAVHDLIGAAEALDRITGLSVAPALPSEEALISSLRASVPVKSEERSGREFSNRFYEFPLPEVGVHVLLSAGTGRKLDESLLQPFVTRLTQVASTVDAALVFGKRWDRLSRRAWALGPLMTLLEGSEAFLGDGRRGIRRVGGLSDIEVFLSASMSEEEAAKLPVQTRLGMLRRTGERMVDGRVAFHAACPAPPGFARVRVQNASGGVGESLLVLDDPMWLPPEQSVAAGLPNVWASDDARVSQVGNVRWLLKRLGRPEWNSRALAEGLAQRRFSTDGLRKMHGPDAHWGVVPLPKGPYTVFSSVIRNLDLYESGTFRLDMGVEGVEEVVVHDCVPPGGWASKDDFTRIRAWRESEAKRRARRQTMSLGGVECTFRGDAARLLTSRAHRKSQEPGYLTVLNKKPEKPLRREAAAYVSHRELAGSIVEALQRLDFEPLQLWHSEVDVDEDLDVTSQLRVAEATLASLQQQREAWLSDVVNGQTRGISGVLLRDISARYQLLVDRDIPNAEIRVEELVALLERRRTDRALALEGIEAEDLLRFVRGLIDPTLNTYSKLWAEAIRNLHFSLHRRDCASHGIWEVTWSGELLIRGGGQQFVVPFAGVRRDGIGVLLGERVETLLAQMRAGIPLCDAVVDRKHDVYRAMILRLKQNTRVFVTGKCQEPRILRVAMALHVDPELSDESVAAEFQESAAFVSRIRAVHLDQERKWFVWAKPDGRGVGALLARASQQGGVLRQGDHKGFFKTWQGATGGLHLAVTDDDLLKVAPKQGFRVKACEWCGSHRRGSVRIPEPVGLVCLDCWRDSAGLQWFPEIGRWLDNCQAWGL